MNGLSSILGNISFEKILSGLNKSLNIVNQAIPLYQQLKPIISNSKDILSIINTITNNDTKDESLVNNENQTIKNVSNNNSPTFFQ